MNRQLLDAIHVGLHYSVGVDVRKCAVKPVGGGCINRTYVIEADPPFFVKVNDAAQEDMFDAEWDALKDLADTSAIRVPCPMIRGKIGEASFLVLEFLDLHCGKEADWELMGRQLADLHRMTSVGDRFGWHRDNYIGATPQQNPWHTDWINFWRHERLEFQLKLAAKKGMRFSGNLRLLDRIESYFEGYSPVASLLHGDLWSGNAGFTSEGKPVIFDPACYFGDRECDLAFTGMFGGFPREFYEAYDIAWPRHEGWRQRHDLYNLYHVLNHANLFGGYYAGQADEMITRLGAGP